MKASLPLHKKALLLSGGFDSLCVAEKVKEKDVDFIFFDYGQIYLYRELKEATSYCKDNNLLLKIIKLYNMYTDVPNRNFMFIAHLKLYGYEEVYLGVRNILPLFDKYKDSNWLSLIIFSRLFNIKVKLPILWWSKKRVYRFLAKRKIQDGYNCYNNSENFTACTCVNCKERFKLLKYQTL